MKMDSLKSMIFYIYILFKSASIKGGKVKERFVNVPNHHFTFSVPCVDGDANPVYFGWSYETMFQHQKGINYTAICEQEGYYGTPNENGTYDGMIGAIQSNVTSTAALVHVPYDSVPHEPGIFVQSPDPAFIVHIYSRIIRGINRQDLDILNLYSNYSDSQWSYFGIMSNICFILITSFTLVLNRHRKSFKWIKWIKSFFQHAWNTYMLIIDMAPTSISNLLSVSVLWTSIVISCYYGFHMIFMSTLSADLVASEPDKFVDTVYDLLRDPPFATMRPTISTLMNMYLVLMQSRNGTLEKELLDKSNRTNSIIEFDTSSPNSFLPQYLELFKDLGNGTRAIVEDSSVLDMTVTHFLCHEQTFDVGSIHKSKEQVFNRPMSMILSKTTEPEVVELYHYRSVTGVELGILKGGQRHHSQNMITMAGIKLTSAGFQCADKFNGVQQNGDNESQWNPLPIKFIQRLLVILTTTWIVSIISLLLEILLFKSTKSIIQIQVIIPNK